MTALAASLFAFGALAAIWIMAASWLRYGREAFALRARLEACPGTMTVSWKMIERVPVPALAALRKDRKARLPRQRSGLEWPGADHQTRELAA